MPVTVSDSYLDCKGLVETGPKVLGLLRKCLLTSQADLQPPWESQLDDHPEALLQWSRNLDGFCVIYEVPKTEVGYTAAPYCHDNSLHPWPRWKSFHFLINIKPRIPQCLTVSVCIMWSQQKNCHPLAFQLLQDIDWVSVEGVRDRVYTLMEFVQSMLGTNLK